MKSIWIFDVIGFPLAAFVLFRDLSHKNAWLNQGCGVVMSRRFLGGVGFLTTLGIGVVFYVRLWLQKSNWIIFLHRAPNLGIPVEMVQFLMKLLLKQRILAVHHDFHW